MKKNGGENIKKNEVKSFTFFRDYFNLIDTINVREKKAVLVAIVDYMFKDIEPKLSGHSEAIFNTLKHQLDVAKSNSKRSLGHKANKEKESLKEEKKQDIKVAKTEEPKKKPEKKPKDNQNSNKSKRLSISISIYNFLFKKLLNKYNNDDIDKLRENIIKWLEYKQERKELYKERGLNALLTQIENNADEYGIDAVCDLITECMASNYKGIIFDKLKKKNQQQYFSFEERKRLEEEKMWEDLKKKVEGEKNDN